MPAPRPSPSAPAPQTYTPTDGAHAEILFAPETDKELEDWKRARRWQPPWRQIAFTASLCFGIAAFVLPDSVNEAVDWLLYGLSAVSLYTGLTRKRA